MSRFVLLAAALAGIAGVGYLVVSGDTPAPPPSHANANPAAATGGGEPAVAALRSRLEPGRRVFPEPIARDPANAALFVRLADTSDDPHELEAALRAIPLVYAARATPRRPGPDAELERVLARRVSSPSGRVALAALEAAHVPLMAEAPGPALTAAVAELAGEEHAPARRHAALDALLRLRPTQRGGAVLEAFEQALRADPPELVSLALLALADSGPALDAGSPEQRRAIAARVLELTAHADPGVRGHALLVLRGLGELVENPRRLGLVRDRLDDPHAFVRAQAAALADSCAEPLAIHWLVTRVADLGLARYELDGWTRLDGSPGTLVHTLPGRARVADAALFAVQALSRPLDGVSPLRLTLGGREATDAQVLESAELTRAWYAAARARLPAPTFDVAGATRGP